MVKEKEVMEPRKYYEYYCDKCGKKTGEGYERDDGYIALEPVMRSIFMQLRFDGKTYDFRGKDGNLCERCYAKAKEDMLKKLAAFGFEME